MRIDNEGFFHLTYCSNIHPGESWSEVLVNLKEYIPQLKSYLAPTHPFGIGLRLSNQAANELLEGSALAEFKSWLSANQLYVFTINGFPYGGFHHQRVKEQVYAPDWLTVERRDYSLKLVKILSELTAEGDESGFSTSPLSYKPWLDPHETEMVFENASIFLCQIVAELVAIYKNKNVLIHIDIEPEPDCLIETIDEAIQFFQEWLIPSGVPYLVNLLKISPDRAEKYLRNHVRVCYDICHSSVEFENPAYVFKRLRDAHIKIGKIQISAALKSKVTDNLNARKKLAERLSQFADPVYLHQVVEHSTDGVLHHFTDLNLALTHLDMSQVDELRTHFHVPLFLENYKMLQSTQNDVITALKLVQKNKATHHLEIETYTWEVLPADLKLDLLSSLKREYEWVLRQFHV